MTGGIQEQLPKIVVKPHSLEGNSVGEISMSGLNLVREIQGALFCALGALWRSLKTGFLMA